MTDPASVPPVERRGKARGKTFLGARITFNNDMSTLDCLIRNVSSSGACIEMDNVELVPAEFDIAIPTKNRMLRARTTWRSHGSFGVEFIDPAATARAEQIRAAAIANERLTEAVRDLTRRLEALAEAGIGGSHA